MCLAPLEINTKCGDTIRFLLLLQKKTQLLKYPVERAVSGFSLSLWFDGRFLFQYESLIGQQARLPNRQLTITYHIRRGKSLRCLLETPLNLVGDHSQILLVSVSKGKRVFTRAVGLGAPVGVKAMGTSSPRFQEDIICSPTILLFLRLHRDCAKSFP